MQKRRSKRDSLKTRRPVVLSNPSMSGEEFLDRLYHCTRSTLKFGQDSSCFLDERFYLERQWKDIITTKALPKKTRRQQSAIWEFLTTERTYITRLNIIVKLFLQIFRDMKVEGDLMEIDEYDIFANSCEVLRVNEQFWMDFLLPVLKRTREHGTVIIPSELLMSHDKIINFKNMFKCYERFCLKEEECVNYVRDIDESSSSELQINKIKWLNWCESLSHCDRLKLKNLLTEPRQRLSRYCLLLSAILKETTDRSEIEFLQSILKECTDFLTEINDEVHERVEQRKLVSCLETFEEETITEADNEDVKRECFLTINFLRLPIKTLNVPLPRFFLESTAVRLLPGKKTKKINVFLFSDVLFLAILNRDTKKFRIISQLYFLDKINLLNSKQSRRYIVVLYRDEFGLLAKSFSLDIQHDERDMWMATVKRAKQCYENALAGKAKPLDFFKFNDIASNTISYLKRGTESQTLIYYENDDVLNRKTLLKETTNEHEPISLDTGIEDDIISLDTGIGDETISLDTGIGDEILSLDTVIGCEVTRNDEVFETNNYDLSDSKDSFDSYGIIDPPTDDEMSGKRNTIVGRRCETISWCTGWVREETKNEKDLSDSKESLCSSDNIDSSTDDEMPIRKRTYTIVGRQCETVSLYTRTGQEETNSDDILLTKYYQKDISDSKESLDSSANTDLSTDDEMSIGTQRTYSIVCRRQIKNT